MYFALTSVSKDTRITFELLRQIAAALETQLYRDYAPFWQSSGCAVRTFAHPDTLPLDGEACPLVVFDSPAQAGALGWHTVAPNGRAFGRVFWEPIKAHGGELVKGSISLSTVLSHEALEMVGDPYVCWWADIDGETQEALELCDRVQAQSYDVDGVSVSNFLGPRAFRSGDGPYDYMRSLSSPWEIAEGGYAIRRKVGTTPYQEWSGHVADWIRDAKQLARGFGRKANKR